MPSEYFRDHTCFRSGMSVPPAPAAQPQLISVRELQARTGLSRTTIYAELKAGRLCARKVGRRTVFAAKDIELWIDTLPKLRHDCVEHPPLDAR